MSGSFLFKNGESLANMPYEIPSSCLLDLGLRYNEVWGELSFRCYNILNHTYRLGGHRAPILQQGRNFLATLSINLH